MAKLKRLTVAAVIVCVTSRKAEWGSHIGILVVYLKGKHIATYHSIPDLYPPKVRRTFTLLENISL